MVPGVPAQGLPGGLRAGNPIHEVLIKTIHALANLCMVGDDQTTDQRRGAKSTTSRTLNEWAAPDDGARVWLLASNPRLLVFTLSLFLSICYGGSPLRVFGAPMGLLLLSPLSLDFRAGQTSGSRAETLRISESLHHHRRRSSSP